MMTFAAPAESYDRYMGRYSRGLAPLLADLAQVGDGMRVLDVGCGPGALTEHLAGRVGAELVAAVDPSESFAQACAARVPGADVRAGGGERLPWADGSFDVVLSQLVVNFMDDPSRGVREMARVARTGGVVAACVWDHARMEMLRTFWEAALALDPDAPTEASRMRYGTPEELTELWSGAGLDQVETGSLAVTEEYEGFDDYWEPFTAGVGPGGAYCVGLAENARVALREECRRRLGDPSGRFELEACAWAVRGVA
jgi:ubiquinone/menaquinone biosynthesis C-methylase UbiE